MITCEFDGFKYESSADGTVFRRKKEERRAVKCMQENNGVYTDIVWRPPRTGMALQTEANHFLKFIRKLADRIKEPPLVWYQVRLPVSAGEIHFKNFRNSPGEPYPAGVTCRYLVHDCPVRCCSVEAFWEMHQLDFSFTWDGVAASEAHRESWDEQDWQLNNDLTVDYFDREGKRTPKETWPHAYELGVFEDDPCDRDRQGYYNALDYSQGNHLV